MLNVGLIGLGRIVREGYIPAIVNNPHFKLHSFTTRNSHEEGKSIAQTYGAWYFPNLNHMLESDDIDVIIIASHAIYHYQNLLKCLSHKKTILVEKPLVTNRKDLEQLQSIPLANQYIYTSFQRRFSPFIRKAKDLLTTKQLGRIIDVICYDLHGKNSDYYVRKKNGALDGGGVLINQAIHSIDLLRYFFGDFQDIKHCELHNDFFGIEVEDSVHLDATMKTGERVSYFATSGSHLDNMYEIHILGTRGSIVINNHGITTRYLDDTNHSITQQENGNLELPQLLSSQLDSLYQAITTSEKAEICSFGESANVLDFVLRIYEKSVQR